jgi:hypothetical protein
VQDTRNGVVTAFTGSAVLATEQYKICSRLRKPEQTESLDFLFSCYAYERDAHVSSPCAIADLFKDMQNMLQYPVLTPSRPVSELSVQEAEVRLTDCRENVHGMFDTFDSIFLDTVVRELGQADNAAAVKNSIDWTRSHTVAADAAVESLINSTKLLYTQLAQLSNTAVPAKWLADSAFDGTVRNLLATRQSLLQNVRGRRTALADVTRVRSDFLCLDAIDSVLRHICRHEDEQAAEHPLSASLALPCHRYWLEQMKANTHNSVPLSAETYLHASTILDACAAARACPRMLPHSAALVASGPAAALTYKLWQSMHLQGLGIAPVSTNWSSVSDRNTICASTPALPTMSFSKQKVSLCNSLIFSWLTKEIGLCSAQMLMLFACDGSGCRSSANAYSSNFDVFFSIDRLQNQ